MFECVINISEGVNVSVIRKLALVAGNSLCDIHVDKIHNRSVLTLVDTDILQPVKMVTKLAVESIDISRHQGLHPRFGAVDVVPFVPFTKGSITKQDLTPAQRLRDDFIKWAKEELGLACMPYGSELSLPQVRKILKDPVQNIKRHQTAGVTCVGARQLLLAYNLYIGRGNGERAAFIAKQIRARDVRSLGFCLQGEDQVSCNIVDLESCGPQEVYEKVSQYANVTKTELVGLIPLGLFERTDPTYLDKLDISYEKTIEYRLSLDEKERHEKILSILEKQI